MSDHVFKSKYSLEEMEKNFKDLDFFNGIKEGLEEALAYEKGKARRTVESWETGRSTPSPTAKNLIYLISRKPDLVLVLQEARHDYSI